jgi:hypothetical protein
VDKPEAENQTRELGQKRRLDIAPGEAARRNGYRARSEDRRGERAQGPEIQQSAGTPRRAIGVGIRGHEAKETQVSEIPEERIHYAGKWWKATTMETMREIGQAIRDGNLPRVFALAVIEGRFREDGVHDDD